MESTELWLSFFANEKLTLERAGENQPRLVELATRLSTISNPKVRPYKARLDSRVLMVDTAIDIGLDLAGIRYRGKIAMSRGLLDVWNLRYQQRFGSIVGTAGEKEDIRRKIKSKLKGGSP